MKWLKIMRDEKMTKDKRKKKAKKMRSIYARGFSDDTYQGQLKDISSDARVLVTILWREVPSHNYFRVIAAIFVAAIDVIAKVVHDIRFWPLDQLPTDGYDLYSTFEADRGP